MRRALAFFLGILMLLTMLPTTAFAEPGDEGASVSLDEKNFPDGNFRGCLAVFDTDKNNALSPAECQVATALNCINMNIGSLEGIEYFTNLTSLNCSQNQLTELDVSALTALKDLRCASNAIGELTLSANAVLGRLDCSANNLTALDVSNYTALNDLVCYANRLTTLNVSGCTALQTLQCFDNRLAALDVSGCTALRFLDCFTNRLATLNVTGCTALERFNCSSNKLTALDVASCAKLIELNCSHNALTALATGALTALESLDCTDNRLAMLDVSVNAQLRSLRCAMNGLTELHVESNSVLWGLYCAGNSLAALDVSHNGVLEELDCAYNNLTALDVSSNTNLAKLYCADNELGTLDVSRNAVLRELNCAGNSLTTLDLTSLTSLNALDCSDNGLSSLDTSKMVSDEYANAPLVFYDGNPLASVTMGASVHVAHAGVDAPLHMDENTGILWFADNYVYGNEETVVTACATVTDYRADGNKTEWLCYQPDPEITLKLNPVGERRFGCLTLRDTVSGLQSRGITDIYVVTNQSAETPWSKGHHDCSIYIGHGNPVPQQTRILGADDALRAVKVVDGITLTQYSGGTWERTLAWNEETQNVEPSGIYYCYALDPLVELTLSQEAADLYNNGSTTYSARLSAYQSTFGGLLGWPNVHILNEDEVEDCGSYTARLKIDGLSSEFDVEIVPGPVEELAVVSRQPVEIMEGTCGKSVSENDGYNQEHTYFRYGEVPGDVVCSATFTNVWAEYNNGGCRNFTGTVASLTNLLGEAPAMGSLQAWDAQWHLGETYDASVSVPGAKCDVSVKITNGPVESITPILSQPLTLIERWDGRWEPVNGGEQVFVYDTQSWHEKISYLVLFSDEGAAYYGRRSFTGQLWQLEELFGVDGRFEGEQVHSSAVSGDSITPWDKGRHEVTLYLLGASCTVPLEVVESPLAEVALADGKPIELERGLDGYWMLGETEDGAPGHFYYDLINRQVWNEVEQNWTNVYDRVVATFTDAGMARYGVARSGEYDLYELSALQDGGVPECLLGDPGENWAVGEEHKLPLSVLGKTIEVPVKIVAPRVELESMSFGMSETNPLVEGQGIWNVLLHLDFTLTYKEKGDTATATDTMSGMDMLYRWGIQPVAEPVGNLGMQWRAGETYQIAAGCMDKVATATVVPRESSSSVALTEENFPDEAFRQYLQATFDQDGDDTVPVEQVESISICGGEIRNLEGIRLFTKLTSFDSSNHSMDVTTLDLSACTSLRHVYCCDSTLETLKVSGCTALQELHCANSIIGTLDASNCTSLRWIKCGDNELKELNVKGCTALRNLSCSGNSLEALELSDCTALRNLSCSGNKLEALDISKNAAIFYLDCAENALKTLDVSNCTELEILGCGQNALTSLNLDNNTALRYLSCSGNRLAALDISKNAALYYLDCGRNALKTLDVSNCTELCDLFCAENALETLDVSKCTELEILGCGQNALTSLNLANNTALLCLYCDEISGLTTLDVSKQTSLMELVVRNCCALASLHLDHSENLWLETFGTSPNLQVTMGDTVLKKKNLFAADSSLGDSDTPVELCLESKDGKNTIRVVTDNSAAVFGDFTGAYTVTVSKEGYVPRTFDADLGSENGADVKIVRKGDLNGIAGVDKSGQVDDLDCQRIYEVLNGVSPLKQDENLVGKEEEIQYAQQVADTNDDGTLNILDYQFLYEMVVSQREQSQ